MTFKTIFYIRGTKVKVNTDLCQIIHTLFYHMHVIVIHMYLENRCTEIDFKSSISIFNLIIPLI